MPRSRLQKSSCWACTQNSILARKYCIVQSPLDGGVWDLFFTLRLIYLDKDSFITQLNGPPAQQVPVDQLDHYDHIFTYQGDRYVELDNADTRRSVRLRLVKADQPGARIGESMTVSSARCL